MSPRLCTKMFILDFTFISVRFCKVVRIFLYDLSIALTVGSGNYPEFWLLNYFIIENMEINKKRERNWIIKND